MKRAILVISMALSLTFSIGKSVHAEEVNKVRVTFEKGEECLHFFGDEESYEELESKEFSPGEAVSVFVVPESGLLIENVYLKKDDTVLSVFSSESFSFTMPDHDVTLQVELKEPAFSEEDSKEDDRILGEFTNPKKERRIQLKIGSKIRYGSYLTHRYSTGDDTDAYCLNPSKRTPKEGTYTGKLVTNKNVLRAAYYAYGGSGYQEFKKQVGTWGNGSTSNEYAMSHVMLAYVYGKEIGGNKEGAFRGMSADAKSKLKSKIAAMEKLPAPTAGFYCYILKTAGIGGNGNTQMMLCQCKRGRIQLSKASSNPIISEGNENYSLAGAVYKIFDSKGEDVASVATNESGMAGPSEYLPYGDYTVKETAPAKGYALDETTFRLSINDQTVDSNQNVLLNVSDIPQNQPMEILLRKRDLETGKEEPQGNARLQCAEFTVKFFEVQSDSNPEEKGYEAARTWRFQTDEEGKIKFKKEYLCGEGNAEFYYQKDGKTPCLPLGTVTIEETKAPKGYLRNETIFVQKITSKGQAESVSVYQITSVPEQVYRGDLELVKVGDGTLKRMINVPFKITSKTTGESHTLLTDKNGYLSTGSLWNSHCENTNKGETSQDGIWFGEGEPEDSKGALIFDDYEIEEQECEANAGMKLLKFDISVYRNNTIIPLGTLTDDLEDVPEEEEPNVEEPEAEEPEVEEPSKVDKEPEKKTEIKQKNRSYSRVRTGDEQKLILLMVLVILSCTLIFVCDRIAHKD